MAGSLLALVTAAHGLFVLPLASWSAAPAPAESTAAPDAAPDAAPTAAPTAPADAAPTDGTAPTQPADGAPADGAPGDAAAGDAAPGPEGDAAPVDMPAPDRLYEGPTNVDEPPAPAPELVDPKEGAAESGESTTEEAKVEPAPASDPAAPQFDSAKPREYPRVLQHIVEWRKDERAYVGKKVKFYPGIQVRNQVGYVSPFEMDRFGERYEEGAFSTGRIRWNPELDIKKKFKIVGTLDLANGRWAPTGSDDAIIDDIVENGQPPGRTDLRIVDPRELYFEARLSFGLLRIGQQSFTWGRGMLANDGNNIDRFGDMRFGDDSPGDIYERVLFGTKPFKYRAGWIKDLVIAFGGDLVFRDERVDLVQGDLAGQALTVIRWQDEKKPWNYLGGYAVYRRQRTQDDDDVYPDDDDLEVGAVDLSGQGVRWLRDDLQIMGGFEGAFIFGRTTIARDERGSHQVYQGGWSARGYIGNHESWLVGLDAGYASGDPDPTDRFINNFTFDAGHTVGLVLFNQIRGYQTARTEMLATDGELTGVPLNGTQFLPTRGGVTNAIYVFPKARYALWEKLEVWGGPLIAAAPVPVIDPYTTRLAGGTATNSLGGDGGRRYYGTELDLGLRGRFDLKNFWLQAGVQGGLLLPGPAMADAGDDTGNPTGAVWFRTELRY